MSVRFFRLDKHQIKRRLREYANRLAEDPQVLAVVLFGSHARDEATAMSDADVLILLDHSERPFHERIPDFLRTGAGVSLDLFPYTIAEAQQSLQQGWGVLPAALREGVWLVEKGRVREKLEEQGLGRRS